MAAPNPFDKESLSAILGGTAAFGAYGSSPAGIPPPLSTLNTKIHMSTLRNSTNSPPKVFPPFLTPPHNLPIRVAPNTEALARLDALYQEKLSQGHKPVEIKDQTNSRDEPPEETRSKEMMKALERHMKDRLPYVQLASWRLQAVVGERNEMAFELPDLSLRSSLSPLSPVFGGNGAHLDACGSATRAVARGGFGSPARKDSWVGMISATRSPTGMLHSVDKDTGKGLREFLLSKGKECGMRKRECKSISFHDFTPKGPMQTFSNILLGHYSAEKGERVDVYEVDLPTTATDPTTGAETVATETWLWFLISRSILSLTSDDKSTIPRPDSPTLSADSSRYQTPFSTFSNLSFPTPSTTIHPAPAHPTPPPNFPYPLPTSWLVFALPLAHCTVYPEIIEKDIITQPPNPSPYPFLTSNQQAKRIHKRCDYDLSFQGVPIFEFASSELFTTNSRLEFLSIENIGPWYDTDHFAEYSKEEMAEVMRKWDDEGKDLVWDSDDELEACGEGGGPEIASGVKGSKIKEMPAPNRGTWWEVFYKRMYADCRKWEKVRTAMGRGKCRVVVRWEERERMAEDDEDGLDIGMGEGGMGMGRGRGRVPRGKERMTLGKHARMTRSEMRRRSALGLGGESSSGIVIGVGVGDTARSRALANKDLTKADKAKARKR